jgi:CelD/BcsL family acetyltransferase involved in cellulose biosynthesis
MPHLWLHRLLVAFLRFLVIPLGLSAASRTATADTSHRAETHRLARTGGARTRRPDELSLELLAPDDARVEATWRGLEANSAPPFFLSWGWIENWLACVPRADAPPLAVVSRDGAPVAAFFVGRKVRVRHGVVPSRALFLNATGVPRLDELCIEHNAVLGEPLPLDALCGLLPSAWDELYLPGVAADAFAAPAGARLRVEKQVAAPYVDLARVRAAPGGYVSLLGAQTRAQLRRARRAVGPITIEVADGLARASEIYDELVALHQASWRARGQPGAFADPWFDRFHRRLIARRFAHGDVQLVRVRAGDATLGCLYNLVGHGRVLFYQSGIARVADPRIKPGYLCHAAAIELAAAAGHARYDFLGGDARYKRQLATDAAQLAWLRVQRPRARFALEDRVRRWLG